MQSGKALRTSYLLENPLAFHRQGPRGFLSVIPAVFATMAESSVAAISVEETPRTAETQLLDLTKVRFGNDIWPGEGIFFRAAGILQGQHGDYLFVVEPIEGEQQIFTDAARAHLALLEGAFKSSRSARGCLQGQGLAWALERVIAEELSERLEITIHLEPSREYIRVAGGTSLRRLQFVRRFNQ